MTDKTFKCTLTFDLSMEQLQTLLDRSTDEIIKLWNDDNLNQIIQLETITTIEIESDETITLNTTTDYFYNDGLHIGKMET